MNFDTKQDLTDCISPEFTPDEAKQYLPFADGKYHQCILDHDAANNVTDKCQEVLDDDDATLRYIRDTQPAESAELGKLKADFEVEFHETRGAFNLNDACWLIRRKLDVADFRDAYYDKLLTVIRPAHHILYLDAVENQLRAECSEMAAAAALSRVKTIAALGPVIALEGSNIGVIGAFTENLRSQVQVLAKKIEVARNAARDARIAYDRQQTARISRGIITSANLPNAIR